MPATEASAVPQPKLHIAAVAEQVTAQLPSHLMSQLDVSLHITVLPAPRLILQSAPLRHVAVELAPALSSHFDEPSHTMTLLGPPVPLHSASLLQLIVTAAVEFPLHLVLVSHVRLQADSSHSARQSSPELHVHAVLVVQSHPAPVQLTFAGAESLPPQPKEVVTVENAARAIANTCRNAGGCVNIKPSGRGRR